MKTFLMLAVAVVLSACGAGDADFTGALHQAELTAGGLSRRDVDANVTFVEGDSALQLEVLGSTFVAHRDEGLDTFTFEPRGAVMGGHGTRVGERLSFTVWFNRGQWPSGIVTWQFDGAPGRVPSHAATTLEPGTVSPSRPD